MSIESAINLGQILYYNRLWLAPCAAAQQLLYNIRETTIGSIVLYVPSVVTEMRVHLQSYSEIHYDNDNAMTYHKCSDDVDKRTPNCEIGSSEAKKAGSVPTLEVKRQDADLSIARSESPPYATIILQLSLIDLFGQPQCVAWNISDLEYQYNN